jgi:hypothetical protein
MDKAFNDAHLIGIVSMIVILSKSLTGTAQWYSAELIGGSSPGRVWEFSLHYRVQTGSGAEVKNAWSYTSNPPIRLHDVVLS